MKNDPPKEIQSTSSSPNTSSQHSRFGIASFISGLLAVSIVIAIIVSLLDQSYKVPEQNSTIASQLPNIALALILLSFILGISNLAEKDRNKAFGILGLLLCGFTLTICSILFGLIFVSSGGFGG